MDREWRDRLRGSGSRLFDRQMPGRRVCFVWPRIRTGDEQQFVFCVICTEGKVMEDKVGGSGPRFTLIGRYREGCRLCSAEDIYTGDEYHFVL